MWNGNDEEEAEHTSVTTFALQLLLLLGAKLRIITIFSDAVSLPTVERYLQVVI